MKKVLMICLGLVFSSSIYSKVYYQKAGGFFNRFKYVTQTNFNNGDIFMECHDPGWTRCRAQDLVIRFDGSDTPITGEEFTAIDETVTKSAAAGRDTGKFIFNEKFYVTFSYNLETDKLTTSIYTIAEAKSLNLL